MKQEDKNLLLKDLSSRLPYGVILNCCNIVGEKLYTIDSNGLVNEDYDLEEVKPYLFPMSSMTEEQKEELENLGWNFDNFEIHNVNECLGTYREYVAHSDCSTLIDWLNRHHFDYRGLIKKGLAIDATGLNIY